jgi:hypothetical protein
MSNINKREEISGDFNQLTEENQGYALAVVRALLCAQNNEEPVWSGRDSVGVELKS